MMKFPHSSARKPGSPASSTSLRVDGLMKPFTRSGRREHPLAVGPDDLRLAIEATAVGWRSAAARMFPQ